MQSSVKAGGYAVLADGEAVLFSERGRHAMGGSKGCDFDLRYPYFTVMKRGIPTGLFLERHVHQIPGPLTEAWLAERRP